MLPFSVKKYKAEMLEMLSRLIAIPSVKGKSELNMPYGRDNFKALMFVLDQAERMDLESVNLFGHMGYASYGHGDEVVGILTHLDVVPAGDGWETDPFEMTIKDGRAYGRGAVDDKGPAVAALFALYAIKNNCISLGKEVRVYFGCDEESGWGDIDFYKQNYPEIDYVISPDAGFPIINREKGLLHMEVKKAAEVMRQGVAILDIQAGTRPNIVPATARCTLAAPVEIIREAVRNFGIGLPAKLEVSGQDGEVQLIAKGKAAHGCHPEEGVNALAYLIAFLNTLPLANGGVEQFVYALAELVGTDYDGRGLGIATQDENSGRLTLNLGAISMKDGEISAKLDCRFPLSEDLDDLFEKVSAKFEEKGIQTEKLHAQPPHYVSEDSELVRSLKEVYEEYFGEPGECLCCSGATYARAFQNSVAFGPLPLNKESTEHGPNEYIEIEDLLKLSEVLASAMIKLAAPDLNDLNI